jgi:hypothetical protein
MPRDLFADTGPKDLFATGHIAPPEVVEATVTPHYQGATFTPSAKDVEGTLKKSATDVAGAGAGLLGLPVVLGVGARNWGVAAHRALAKLGGGQDEATLPDYTTSTAHIPGGPEWWAQKASDWAGIPTITTDTGPGADLRRGLAGVAVGGTAGALPSVARGIASRAGLLAPRAAMPIGSAPLTGALGTTAQVALPPLLEHGFGLDPETAALAGLATPAGMAAGMRGVLRGSATPAEIAARVGQLRKMGIENAPPSIYIGTPEAQALDSWLSRAPVVKGAYAKTGQDALDAFREKVSQAASAVNAPTTGESAGTQLRDALNTELTGRRQGIGTQFDQFYGMIPENTMTPIPHSVAAAAGHLGIDPLAPNLSRTAIGMSPLTTDIARSLTADAGMNSQALGYNAVPFGAVRRARTILYPLAHPDNPHLLTPTEGMEVNPARSLYGGMTPDLAAAGTAYDVTKGIPPTSPASASRTWSTANADYANLMRDMDLTAPVTTAATPNAAWNRYVTMARDNPQMASQLFNLVGSNADRQALAAAHVNAMGAETAGARGAHGEGFNTDRFLTNWNKVGAPQQTDYASLLAPTGLDVPAAADVAGYFKSAGRFNPNWSGSGHTVASQLVGLEMLNDLAAGNPGGIAKMAGLLGAGRLAGHGMMTPGAQNWMASTGFNYTPARYGLLGGQYLDRLQE